MAHDVAAAVAWDDRGRTPLQLAENESQFATMHALEQLEHERFVAVRIKRARTGDRTALVTQHAT